jgi:hypothetical protein
MMRVSQKFRRLTLSLLAVVGLAACSTQPAPKFPELTYTHMPKIVLGVAEIQVVNATSTTSGAKNVEAQMPVSPETALRAWARDRLQANGVSGVAKFVIEDASVTETDLIKTPGLKGLVTKDQSERYDSKIRATLKLEGVPRVTQAFAQAEVSRGQSIAEDATINERDQLLFDLTEATMKDFDPIMAASIRKHLADFVR